MSKDNLKRILNTTSLKTKIFIHLQMADFKNWENGSYKGDVEALQQQTNDLIEIMEDWWIRGQYGGFSKFETNTNK